MNLPSAVLTWSAAESNDHALFFRYAELFSLDFVRLSQPIRVTVIWKFNSMSGYPGPAEVQRMDLLEESLVSCLEKDKTGTLAIVATGKNLREWTFYSQSDAGFMASINIALLGMPPLPIEIHTEEDPNWAVYENLKTAVKDCAT